VYAPAQALNVLARAPTRFAVHDTPCPLNGRSCSPRSRFALRGRWPRCDWTGAPTSHGGGRASSGHGMTGRRRPAPRTAHPASSAPLRGIHGLPGPNNATVGTPTRRARCAVPVSGHTTACAPASTCHISARPAHQIQLRRLRTDLGDEFGFAWFATADDAIALHFDAPRKLAPALDRIACAGMQHDVAPSV
jgi:hypothetical protein